MMPAKFNNKTNGITQRRFLLHGNPLLASWVTDKIGNEWITDLSHIKKLAIYADDEKCPERVHEHQVPEQDPSGKIHPRSTTASTWIPGPSSMCR